MTTTLPLTGLCLKGTVTPDTELMHILLQMQTQGAVTYKELRVGPGLGCMIYEHVANGTYNLVPLVVDLCKHIDYHRRSPAYDEAYLELGTLFAAVPVRCQLNGGTLPEGHTRLELLEFEFHYDLTMAPVKKRTSFFNPIGT